MIGGIQAAGALKMGIVHVQLFCFLIHRVNEVFNSARIVVSKSIGGVISGGDKESIEEVFGRNLVADSKTHFGFIFDRSKAMDSENGVKRVIVKGNKSGH